MYRVFLFSKLLVGGASELAQSYALFAEAGPSHANVRHIAAAVNVRIRRSRRTVDRTLFASVHVRCVPVASQDLLCDARLVAIDALKNFVQLVGAVDQQQSSRQLDA